MPIPNQTKAFLCAAGTVLAWSTVSTAFKVALESLSPMQLIYASMGTAALFLSCCLLGSKRTGELRSLTRSQWLKGAGLGLMLYVYYTVLFVAYDLLPAQIAQPVNYTWAIMLALLGSWLLRQRLSLKEFFWMLFAYTGVVIITSGAGKALGPLSPTGLACVVASTFLYALYWIANTRSNLPQLAGFVVCFGTAFVLAAASLVLRGEALLFPVRPLLGGVYVGLFELAIPFLLWGMALRLSTSVARISTLPFLVPFLALFWIRLVLHEPIAWTTILGLAVIVTGTIMQQRLAARKKGRP